MSHFSPACGLVVNSLSGNVEVMSEFGDYIVYVDESGDHNLTTPSSSYPMFVLVFCIFHIPTYSTRIVPSLEWLKFKYWGHDMVVLHEMDIRKERPPFQILRVPETRRAFMEDLTGVIARAPFTVVASAIKKDVYRAQGRASNPYHVALEHGLERVYMHLQALQQRGKKIHVVFEGRGHKEDAELELEFRRIMDTTRVRGMADTLTFLCVSKKTNSSGLQLADMVARPIGLKILYPEQSNRAWGIIEPKLRRSPAGKVEGWGLKVFP